MKQFSGQIHIRIPTDLHEDLAREAFDRGVSISALCSQALVARRALKSMDPWKTIEKMWKANRKLDPIELEGTIDEAVKSVRAERRKALK